MTVAEDRTRIHRQVDLLSVGRHRVPRQRIVMLPARQLPDAANLAVHGAQAGTVTLAPDRALVISGRDRAAPLNQGAVGIEEEMGVVQGSAITLVDPDRYDNARLLAFQAAPWSRLNPTGCSSRPLKLSLGQRQRRLCPRLALSPESNAANDGRRFVASLHDSHLGAGLMHGLIFLQLQKFAQKQVSPQAWEVLLREANLPFQSYSPARAYPDEELTALIGAASRVLVKSSAAVIEAFGQFIAPELLRLYARLLNPEWKTLDVVENTERLIHAAVRVGNPGAQPPVLDVVRTSADELQLIYTSERKLCHLAKGILAGIACHFGESITVSDEACIHNGDPFCALRVTRTSGAPNTAVVAGHETVIVGRQAEIGAVAQPRFPFLQLPAVSGDLGRLGDYRVVDFLGQGGMGMVFRAIDGRLERSVALKVLHPHHAAEPSMRQRFLREAKAMASVRSDHVVNVFEVGTTADLPYLAMEFLEGESLAAYQERVETVPLNEAVRIAREAALGLAALHGRGLVHRDIKPENLWLESPGGRVKILDLGLARERGPDARVTQTGVWSAPRHTWPPSRPAAAMWTTGPICSALAACCTTSRRRNVPSRGPTSSAR